MKKLKSRKATVDKKKKSLLPGMLEALEEIRQHLWGLKRLPNVDQPIRVKRRKA
jgi:hypothetical protein